MTFTRRNFLKTSAGAAALGAIGMPALAQSDTFIVNMFGGRWENDWRQHVMPKFAEQIGKDFDLDIGLGMAWISNFRAAGPENPPFPAVMLNEKYTAMIRNDGYFAELTPENVPNMADVIEPAILKGNTAVTGMLAPLVIAYRTDLVDEPPKGWADLWDERFRGQLGLYKITNSAATMMAMWAGEHFGSGRDDIETAVAKFKELGPFPQIGYSAQLTPLLSQGQSTLAKSKRCRNPVFRSTMSSPKKACWCSTTRSRSSKTAPTSNSALTTSTSFCPRKSSCGWRKTG